MSFRQYGGINYAAKNNIVKNNFTNANNLSIMNKVGQPDSLINVESTLDVYAINLTSPAVTTNENGVVPKSYVDAIGSGLKPLQACQCATTEALPGGDDPTLQFYGSPLVIDGYTVLTNNRVLVKNQQDTGSPTYPGSKYNGIYVYDGGNLTRALDYKVGDDAYGAYTLVQNGTVNGGKSFIELTQGVVGTAELFFTQFSASITLGQGLEKITQGSASVIQVRSDLSVTSSTNAAPFITKLKVTDSTTLNSATITALTVSGTTTMNGNLTINSNNISSTNQSSNLSIQSASGKGINFLTNGGLTTTSISSAGVLTTNNTAEIRVTAAGTSINGLNVRDLTSGDYLTVIPYNTDGTLNGMVHTGDTSIVSGGNNIDTQNLVITTHSTYFTGVRITPQTALIGAGGLATSGGYDPTSYVLCSGDTVAIKGNETVTGTINGLTVGTGNVSNNNTNTALGYQALSLNTGSTYSSAVGYQSLYKNGSANSTAVGYQSLYNNFSGTANTALGFKTLYTNQGGTGNTAVGYDALYLSNGGGYNTAIGYTAGYKNNSSNNGERNTYIGYQADCNTFGVNNSTAIGANAIITASNQIMLGGDNSGYPNVLVPGTLTVTGTTTLGSVSGNGSNLTNVNASTLTTMTVPSGTYYLPYLTSATGASNQTLYTSANVYYTSSTNTLTVPNLNSFGQITMVGTNKIINNVYYQLQDNVTATTTTGQIYANATDVIYDNNATGFHTFAVNPDPNQKIPLKFSSSDFTIDTSNAPTSIYVLTDYTDSSQKLATTKWVQNAIAAGGGGGGSSGNYGNGADGNLTFDGITSVVGTSLTSGTYSMSRDIYANNVTISGNVTIIPNTFRFFVSGTLTNVSGTNSISANGANAITTTGGVGNTYSKAGGNGATANNAQPGGAGTAAMYSLTNQSGKIGGWGSTAQGGTYSTTNVGAAGTANAYPLYGQTNYFNSLVNIYSGSDPTTGNKFTGGGGGGGGGNGANGGVGAGGGAGGGVLFLYVKTIVVSTGSLTFTANGGAGASAIIFNGVYGGAGGGGGGGSVVLITGNSNPISGLTINANGGPGGANYSSNSGTNGSGAAGLKAIFYNII